MHASHTALVLGATGLVGGHCLKLLLADPTYQSVVTLGRRPLPQTPAHPKHTHEVVDFDRLANYADLFGVQDVFCCLGTTMKQAGSQEAFRRVDFDYPIEAARLALAQEARHYLLVSALGADSASRIFYNRVKGETEEAIRAMSFEGVSILRPSLLTGDRQEKRTGEQVSEAILGAISFVLVGPLRKLRPIAAYTVARALVALANAGPHGIQVYGPEAIRAVADGSS